MRRECIAATYTVTSRWHSHRCFRASSQHRWPMSAEGLTHIHTGRSWYKSEVGTWVLGCCTHTPRSQNRPSRIPWGIAANSIFPGQGRSHLKELRGRSSDHGHNNPSKEHSYNREAACKDCSREHSRILKGAFAAVKTSWLPNLFDIGVGKDINSVLCVQHFNAKLQEAACLKNVSC